MDVAAMARRCPGSRPLCTARLMRHRFFIMASGYASVVRDPAQAVHGVLWDLALRDVRPLDAYEEVGRGLFTKIMQRVVTPGGGRQALLYVGTSVVAGPPLPGYMETVLAAAAAWGLPAGYQRELQRHCGKQRMPMQKTY